MKKIALLLFLIAGSIQANSTVTVNGVVYHCDGSITVINGQAFCDGVTLKPGSSSQFQGPCGPVKVHRYSNPDGSIGGWVNDLAKIAPTVSIAPAAKVCSESELRDQTKVLNKTLITGGVTTSGKVVIDDTTISGALHADGKDSSITIKGAIISGRADAVGRKPSGIVIAGAPTISGVLNIDGANEIQGSPTVSGRLFMTQNAKVTGNPTISGNVYLYDFATFGGSAIVSGNLTLRRDESVMAGIY